MIKQMRIGWIDVIKYFCIIMVILSHLEANTKIWSIFYSPFFLAGFFFVSGYVYRIQGNFKHFVYKKFRQLFIPWLIFSVFNILLSHLISFNQHDNLVTELKWNFLQIRGHGDELWFIAALFVTFIPFYFFIDWYEKNNLNRNGKWMIGMAISWMLSFGSLLYSNYMPREIFPWGTSSLPWHIEYIYPAMFYMVCGYIFRRKFEGKIDKYNQHCNRIYIWIIYLIVIYCPYYISIEWTIMQEIMYDYLQTLVGLLAIIVTAKKIYPIRYIKYIGENTLICFALHGKIYSAIQTMLQAYIGDIYEMILDNIIYSSVFALFLAIMISFLLIIFIYIINRFFPFLIAREGNLDKNIDLWINERKTKEWK